jgi:group II intron reverse transcriptase/maturase
MEPIGERLFHHDSFGYRPGRGVSHALARVRERLNVGLTWLVDADIEKFFDRVPHRPLMQVVKRTFADPWLLALVEAWLDVGPHPASLLRARRGLLQGAVISPFLCNLYLHAFDDTLTRANIPFVRYADDFLLMTNDARSAQQARDAAKRALTKLDLTLHPTKTNVCHAGPDVVFLGERLPRVNDRKTMTTSKKVAGVNRK